MSNVIQQIDTTSINKICSGQVIINLAQAVKELVENSLDAGSTTIEVKLRESGSKLVEVADNGGGVEPCNFQGLTLKHHTSKLKQFEDLAALETFGFRGEALSSLCALSTLTITTRHSSTPCGTQLQFDLHGRIVKETPCSRQIGTTVSLVDLFHPLPVRHAEFHRSLKREFTRMVHLLMAYGLICPGVRISCVNSSGSGKKTTVLSTSGCASIKDTITCIFSAKQLSSLVEFQQASPTDAVLQEFSVKESDSTLFSVTGFVSSCVHGKGRPASDRQFFYVNSRPCDLTKVSRLVNEVYHSYNRHQYPFILLNINITPGEVDVNVTPDKRQLFFQNEKLLLAIIKTSLITMFEPLASSVSGMQILKRPCDGLDTPSGSRSKMFCSSSSPNCSVDNSSKSKLSFVDLLSFARSPLSETSLIPSCTSQKLKESSKKDVKSQKKLSFVLSSLPKNSEPNLSLIEKHPPEDTLQTDLFDDDKDMLLNYEKPPNSPSLSLNGVTTSEKSQQQQQELKEELVKEEADVDLQTSVVIETSSTPSVRQTQELEFSLEHLKALMKERENEKNGTTPGAFRKYRAQISPGDNETAEKELCKELSKDRFSSMEILGQFNKGFIIARDGVDLFIIDQHATDEKYNFEQLRDSATTLETQHLIRPQSLELTVAAESVLLDNLEIVRANGFHISVDDSQPPGHRATLVAAPTSRDITFGSQDIDELIFMLTDSQGRMCRPSRVLKMLASRACRQSVMVGTALSHHHMKRLVSQMGEMEQPWNCPHGRPTIRHLFNLNLVPR